MKEKNGEKPKIQITESVKISNHSTVFSVFESPNLKPTCTRLCNLLCRWSVGRSVKRRLEIWGFTNGKNGGVNANFH